MNGPQDSPPDHDAGQEVAAPPIVGPPVPEAITGMPVDVDSVWLRWRWPVATSATLCVATFAFVMRSDRSTNLIANPYPVSHFSPATIYSPVLPATEAVAESTLAESTADPFDQPIFKNTNNQSRVEFVIAPREYVPKEEPNAERPDIGLDPFDQDPFNQDPFGEETADQETINQATAGVRPIEPHQPLVAAKPFKPLRTLEDPKAADFAKPVCKDGACSKMQSLGTTLQWASSPREAYRMAAEQDKMVFLMHVSGNFEIPGFT